VRLRPVAREPLPGCGRVGQVGDDSLVQVAQLAGAVVIIDGEWLQRFDEPAARFARVGAPG
jgi:hypothetical protein